MPRECNQQDREACKGHSATILDLLEAITTLSIAQRSLVVREDTTRATPLLMLRPGQQVGLANEIVGNLGKGTYAGETCGV